MGKFRDRCTEALESGQEIFREHLAGFAETVSERFGKVIESVTIGDVGQNTNNALLNGKDRDNLNILLNTTTYRGENVDDPLAAYGTVIRALAPEEGDLQKSRVYDQAVKSTGEKLDAAEAGNFASLALAASLQERVKETLPGVEDAVARSFLTAENLEDTATRLDSRKLSERMRAGWVNLARETLGIPVEDSDYPEDGRLRDEIREVAQAINELAPRVGKSLSYAEFNKQTFGRYVSAMLEAEVDEEKEEEKEHAPNHGQGSEGVPAQTEAQAQQRQQEKMEQEIKKAAKGLGGTSAGESTPEFSNQRNNNPQHFIEATEFTEHLRPYLMDERIERQSGHYTGLLSQPQRVLSDFRVMSKRMVLEDTPDTLVVGLVDNSGSMMGPRWSMACEMHDGIMKALEELGIPAISAAYAQWGSDDTITAVNGEGSRPVKLGSAAHPGGGTGDLGAMVWATQKLNEAGKSGRVVFVISDNESPTDRQRMTKMLKHLGARVVHIDLVGQSESQFGVEAVVARSGKAVSYVDVIGQKMREALRIGEE